MTYYSRTAGSILAIFSALTFTSASAQEQLTKASVEFMFQGELVSIVQDNANGPTLAARFAGAAPRCDAGCLGPLNVAPGVTSLGEREVLGFLMTEVVENTGLMVDARRPEDRAVGFIPGSVSLPAGTMDPANGYRDDILKVLGAQPQGNGFDFSAVRHLLIYDIGPAADDAGALVRHLLSAGYPPERISYYRGGMLVWAALGLSVEMGS